MSNYQPRRPWTPYLINLSMFEEESIDETMSLTDAAKLVVEIMLRIVGSRRERRSLYQDYRENLKVSFRVTKQQ